MNKTNDKLKSRALAMATSTVRKKTNGISSASEAGNAGMQVCSPRTLVLGGGSRALTGRWRLRGSDFIREEGTLRTRRTEAKEAKEVNGGNLEEALEDLED